MTVTATLPQTNVHTSQMAVCKHCALPIPTNLPSSSEFCCAGCESAYAVIKRLGLGHYYELLSKEPRDLRVGRRLDRKSASYAHFDDEDFCARYVTRLSSDVNEVTFYLEGIHCAACIWLLEKLPLVAEGIVESRVDFGRSTLQLRFRSAVLELSALANLVHSLGYTPFPVRGREERDLRRATSRAALIRLGVAGLCAMNTMMLAVSMYQGAATGIEVWYAKILLWSSLVIALPAVTYSAWPFYKAAWGGLKGGMLHIDLPISIAIVAGFGLSVVNTFRGSLDVYYDSLVALVFLLLVGRWFQQRSVERVLDSSDLLYSVVPSSALKRVNGGLQQVFVESLEAGDEVLVEPGSAVPVDGVVIDGRSHVSLALLTGESRLESVAIGTNVFAGSRNADGLLVIRAERVGAETRMGRLMQMVANGARGRGKIHELVDRASRRLVFVVIGLALFTFLYWLQDGFAIALNNAIALLIVTCPCALAIATPLTLSVAIGRAARNGILIRGSDVIERLLQLKRVFMDKTGTLTEGQARVVRAIFVAAVEQRRVVEVIQELEAGEFHPLASALRAWADAGAASYASQLVKSLPGGLHSSPLQQRVMFPGKGIQGDEQSGLLWRIGSVAWLESLGITLSDSDRKEIAKFVADGLSPVLLARNQELVALFGCGDRIRAEAADALALLRNRRIDVQILSGDEVTLVEGVAQKLGIAHAFGALSPEDKAAMVRASQLQLPTAMLGDGVNDVAALQAAHVGIGVSGGAEICLRVAHVYLREPGLTQLTKLLEGAERTYRVMKQGLAISVVYNLFGAACAVSGLVSPLLAAILMPISSLTVIFRASTAKTFY